MVRGVEEEAAVLGAILTDGNLYETAAKHIDESHFYRQEYRYVWRACTDLYNTKKSIDLVSVTHRLRSLGILTKAGGASGVSDLIDTVPDVVNCEEYAKSVKTASNSRKLSGVGNGLKDASIEPEQRIDIALSQIKEITKDAVSKKGARVGDVASEIYKSVIKGNGFNKGLMTGFKGLDLALDGVNKDELLILGARPSVGKSAFSLQVAWNMARAGHKVYYVSPEMSKEQLTTRLMAIESDVPYMAIKGGSLSADQTDKLKAARDRIINLPLEINDSAEQNINSLRMQTRLMAASNGIDILMVDYLQLLCSGDDSKEAVTVVSKGLKAIAKDISIPVWAVSQLSRQIEYRDDKRPRLSDIRGSGQLEQDADVCMFIWQPTKTKVEVFIEKNRNGPLGYCLLKFDKGTTKFTQFEGE